MKEHSQNEDVNPLIWTGMFVLDFLSIHLFNNGNGRMALLVTLLIHYQHCFEVGAISVSRRLSKNGKRITMNRCNCHRSIGMRVDKTRSMINYLLNVTLAAYKELEKNVGLVTSDSQNQTVRIRCFVEGRIASFTKSDIRHPCPDISEATINPVLRELRDERVIASSGLGRNAKWIKQ